jgi:hypothetical protein
MLERWENCSRADIRRLQDQIYEDFKTKYMRTSIFSFQSNEASALYHFVHIYFVLIYSVEVELHDRSKVLRKALIGTTRIDCISLQNPVE